LVPTTDLNNALLGFILTGYNGFSSAAGHIGSQYRVDHDISLVVPELWCRLEESERDPRRMIADGHLEKLEDFEFEGRQIPASRLGYRITYDFATHFLGRLFDDPGIVFNEEILKPELQGLADFADGIENIVEAQKKVALEYFEDGSVEEAIPPLKALLHIMAHGHWNGKGASDPEVRALFDRGTVLASEWYQARLDRFQHLQKALFERHRHSLKTFLASSQHAEEAERLGLPAALAEVENYLKTIATPAWRKGLVGTLGADPLFKG